VANVNALLMQFGIKASRPDFPFVFDGNNPVIDLDYQNGIFFFNGVIYTSLPTFVAAGGKQIGDSFISTAGWWSPPHSFRITGISPPSYSASVGPLFELNDGTTNNTISLSFATSPSNSSQIFMRASGVSQAQPYVPSDPLNAVYAGAGVIQTNNLQYNSGQTIATNSPDTSCVIPNVTRIGIGCNGRSGGRFTGEIRRVTFW